MNPGNTKPEWDTPPQGDFAAYVERLTASRPATVVSPPPAPDATTAAATSPLPGPMPYASAQAISPALPALPGALGQTLPALFSGLRVARAFLLVLTLVHSVTLVVWSRGSWVGLLMMGSLWWGLGRMGVIASQLLGSAGARAAVLQAQARLRQKAPQRAPEKNNS